MKIVFSVVQTIEITPLATEILMMLSLVIGFFIGFFIGKSCRRLPVMHACILYYSPIIGARYYPLPVTMMSNVKDVIPWMSGDIDNVSFVCST